VIVVDDDPEVLETLKRWLETEGYSVATFTTMKEALEFCEVSAPVLIFSDVVLPDGDGYQFVRRRSRSAPLSKVPVVLMSGARDDGTAQAMGAGAFVSKPLSRERVFDHVERLVRLKNLPFEPSSKCILLVDDDEGALLQLRAILEGAGYRTAVATTGRAALDLITQELPDGLILDLNLPDMDGWAIVESLRARSDTRHIPVLVFTAREMTEVEQAHVQANHVFRLVTKGDVSRRGWVRLVDAMLQETL